MQQREIAKEVLAVSLHIAEAENFDLDESKRRMQQLTESVLKTNLLRQKPNKNSHQTVDLEFQQIDNLKDLLPHLADCSNLRELILHGNRLHTLPEDLSVLSTVETLDVSNNLFDKIQPIVQALKTMPKLIHLHIAIRNINEEKYIIQELPNLITLNNRRLKFFDQLDSERNSEKQSARSERSQRSQYSEVTFNQTDVENVETLYSQIFDLQNNQNSNQQISGSVLTDHVKEVMTDFQQKVQQTNSKHFLDTHILKAKYDLYEICFRELIEYFRNNNNKLEQVLRGLQQEHQNIFNDLTNVIYNLRDYKKIVKESKEIEKLISDSEIVKQLRNEIENLQIELESVLNEKNKISQQKDQLYQLINPLQVQIQKFEIQIVQQNEEKEVLQNQNSQLEYQLAQLQQQLNKSQRESQKQLNSINQSFQEFQSFSYMQTQQVVMVVKGTQTINLTYDEKQSQTNDQEETNNLTKSIEIFSIQQEIEELQCQNEQLKQENKQYLDMIIRRSKAEKTSQVISDFSYKQTESPSMIEKKRNRTRCEFNLLVQPQSFRPLSLRQLKEIIYDVYESKAKHDQKQFENKMPLETIEQHMYTYLYCKYGLKNLALEWVACIINAVQKYVSEDNDVSVFALMLKNNIDEDFRLKQQQCKQTIEYLLKMNLQEKFKTKHVAEIKEMVKQRMNGQITEQEANDILKYFQEQLRETIKSQLKQFQSLNISSVSPIKTNNNGKDQQRRSSAQKMPTKYDYSVFLKLILDYHLKQHEQYLADLIIVFKEVDHDKDGIVNQVQFQKLCQSIKPELNIEDYQALYLILDPFLCDQITFSQITRVFQNPQLPNRNNDLIQQISIG